MKRIYAVRHGETDLNKKECLQGRIDCPLNENGKKQAHELGELLKELSIERVYSSPLARAMETAVTALGISADALETDERLTEFGYGSYEGKSFSELDKGMLDFLFHPEDIPAPESVETIAALMERTGSFIEDIKACEAETALLVTHGVAMRALFGHILNKGRRAVWGMPIENCTVYEIDLENGTVEKLGF